jgi:hypothetical protein
MRNAARHLLALLLASSALSLTSAAQAQSSAAPATQSAPQTATAAPTTTPPSWPTAQFNSTKDESVQKALKILNDMIRALGGDAYLNLRDMQIEGRSYSFYHGQPSGQGLQFWRFWEWPDKDRWELTKQRDVIELNIGDKGYEITYKGTATQDPKQLEEYLRHREHSLEWVIRKWLPAPGTMILYGGPAMIEQNLADQVTVLNANNDSVTLSIDPRSHLPVKKTYSWRDPIDRMLDEESEVFSNYRLIQGIQTPLSTVRNLNGEMSNQRFMTTASYNNGIPATMFETKGITYNPQKSATPK